MRRSNILTAERILLFASITAALLAVPATAQASSYTGYADTGFAYSNKARCCEDAVAMAQEDSARQCEIAGGYPDFRRTSARGRCDWSTRRGREGTIFRCTASASVSCR